MITKLTETVEQRSIGKLDVVLKNNPLNHSQAGKVDKTSSDRNSFSGLLPLFWTIRQDSR
jgi:hypothetical protein